MVEGWIMVHRSIYEYQTSLIKEILEAHDLHPVVLDRKDDEFLIGDVEIYVAPEEADQARQVIAENVFEDEEE
jgi:hypothetical protein